jgi:hypothetical protein
MADTPTPRSYQQILGDSIDVLLSKAGLKGIKVGGPIAEILETQATSAMRTSQDIFQMLASRDVDNADGEALARAGRDEGLEQEGATFATTLVTVGDSNFIKKSTRIYQAKAAPAAGTSVVYVIDASSFPASGSIYLGRGTANAEGPLAYSSRALDGSGNFWAITLAGNTTKFHNVGDSVIVAQGGDRVVGVGTICTTLARNDGTSLKFETTNRVVLQDGEDLISGVRVRCLTAGIEGNVPAGAIQDFDSAPFVGATVTNLSKVTNALAAESKEEFRERIKAARRSKTKGTGLAITSAVFRASASDEDATVTSSNLVVQDDTYTLYIDDGSGYEPKSSGIAIETLIESAAGGEQDFQILGGVPLVKAFSKARDVAPYNLTDGSVLSVKIGGETSSVSFLAEDFLDITNATAYEVVSAINADPNSTFAARTVDSGQSFVVFAKADANEDVQVIAAASGLTDANEIFAFPAARYDTLRLYLNDVLLYKDGIDAAIDSTPQSQWNSTNFATGIKMTVAVDGTVGVQYTFTDADFVNARTGYTALAAGNSLAAWAAVINAKIPGLTATAQSNTLRIKSNLGASSRASVVLSAMDAGFQSMFSTTSATGRDADYSLNRNTGEIHLTDALQPGDRLSAGTPYTRAYIESGDFSALTVGGSGANLWWVVDGAAQVISTGTTVGTIYTVSISGGWFITLTGAAGSFSNVQSGDWLILWDSSFGSKLQGTWRVSAATSTTVTFEIGTSLPSTGALPALTAAGLAVVRSDAVVQKLVVPAGSVSPASIAGMVAVQMFGVSATTPRSTRLRLTTDTFGGSGDISLVAADTEGAKLPFTIKNVVSNTPHLGSSESGNTDHGTPNFYWGTITGTGNNGHLADSNCVALWRMDEAAGSTAADATGNGYTLTSGAQVPAVIAGVIGNGRSFVANVGTPLNSNYFATADMGTTNAALIHTGPYTVEGWFARTGPKAGARSYGVYFGFGGALNTLLRAYYDPSTGNIGLGWYNGFDFFYDTGVSTALNTWFHMAVRMTSLGGVNRQLELFVNGVKVYTTPSTPQPLASTDLTFSVGTYGRQLRHDLGRRHPLQQGRAHRSGDPRLVQPSPLAPVRHHRRGRHPDRRRAGPRLEESAQHGWQEGRHELGRPDHRHVADRRPDAHVRAHDEQARRQRPHPRVPPLRHRRRGCAERRPRQRQQHEELLHGPVLQGRADQRGGGVLRRDAHHRAGRRLRYVTVQRLPGHVRLQRLQAPHAGARHLDAAGRRRLDRQRTALALQALRARRREGSPQLHQSDRAVAGLRRLDQRGRPPRPVRAVALRRRARADARPAVRGGVLHLRAQPAEDLLLRGRSRQRQQRWRGSRHRRP